MNDYTHSDNANIALLLEKLSWRGVGHRKIDLLREAIQALKVKNRKLQIVLK